MRPKGDPKHPKTPPGRLKSSPRAPRERPKSSPRAPGSDPEAPRSAPRGPLAVQEASRGASGGLGVSFWSLRGLFSTIYSYIFPCLQVPSSGAKSVTTRLNLPLKSPKPWQSRPQFDANQGGGGDTPQASSIIRRPLAGVSDVGQILSILSTLAMQSPPTR